MFLCASFNDSMFSWGLIEIKPKLYLISTVHQPSNDDNHHNYTNNNNNLNCCNKLSTKFPWNHYLTFIGRKWSLEIRLYYDTHIIIITMCVCVCVLFHVPYVYYMLSTWCVETTLNIHHNYVHIASVFSVDGITSLEKFDWSYHWSKLPQWSKSQPQKLDER